mmetsp:Transcript_15922/g.28777  ORF Transcript_15922/g.28777 Transcript_15922/m.28777 type:complete len:119 (-) Transcript_15922:287-643(-)
MDKKVQSMASSCVGGGAMNQYSNKFAEEKDKGMCRPPKVEDEKDPEIDCFYAVENAGRLAQLNEDEISTASSVGDNKYCVIPCFDECVEDVGESIDISFHVVEKFYRRAVCCEGPEKF